MRSRALAVVLTLLSLAAFTGAAFFIKVSEHRIASTRVAVRAFDAAARDAAIKIAHFDAETAGQSLATLRSMSTRAPARAAIDEASAGVAELSDPAPLLARVGEAQAAERHATDDDEVAQRKLEAMALGASAAVGLAVPRGADNRVADNA